MGSSKCAWTNYNPEELSIRSATKTVSETELQLQCIGLGRVMGLVFNDLGQETKGISTKRLRYGRINTLYSNQASDDFQHSFQTQKPREGGKKYFPNSLCFSLSFYYCNNTEEIKELSSLSGTWNLLKISICNCIISLKVSLSRVSNMYQNATLLPRARTNHKLAWTPRESCGGRRPDKWPWESFPLHDCLCYRCDWRDPETSFIVNLLLASSGPASNDSSVDGLRSALWNEVIILTTWGDNVGNVLQV